jgi:hypothetical protein
MLALLKILRQCFNPKLLAISTMDAGPSQPQLYGVTAAGASGAGTFTSADQHSVTAAVTDQTPAGAWLVITDIVASSDTLLTLTFTEETTGTIKAKMFMPASGGAAQYTPRGKLKLDTAGKRLLVQASVSGNIAVGVHYYFEPFADR